MMMREWWANVYAGGDMGAAFTDRADAEWFTRKGGFPAAYRIHVRLKPEGAPKRYASEANRRAWETYPLSCLNAVREHGTPAGYPQHHTEQSEREARP